MDPTYHMIREAIAQKRPIYVESVGGCQYLCPHVLGLNRDEKTGILRPQFLSYEYDGESGRALCPANSPQAFQNWCCMFVEEVSLIELLKGPWFSSSRQTMFQACDPPALIDLQVTDWS
jgi:hypothetical protein